MIVVADGSKSMSRYDGTGEKPREGGDSADFRGRRHPFLDRRIDWKAIDKARYGNEAAEAGLAEIALPFEIPPEILPEVQPFGANTRSNPRDQLIDTCVAAVKLLATDMQKWYVIRDCLIKEYRSAGPDKKKSKKALINFVGVVNKRLGAAGGINIERVIGLLAEQIAAAENVQNPELSVYVRVQHSAGTMGPIGVCFTNSN